MRAEDPCRRARGSMFIPSGRAGCLAGAGAESGALKGSVAEGRWVALVGKQELAIVADDAELR